jgi:hypothetical protein
VAHFKPFARAEGGAPSHRRSSRHSRNDSSHRYHRRYRRHHRNGLVIIDFG